MKEVNMKYKDIIKMPMPSPNTHNDISIEDMTKLAIKIIADDKASEQKKDAVCNALLNNAKELDRQQRAEQIRERNIAIQRVDAQVKGVKKW
tara:strand:- start:202 stop:477 length:276 start_codon:yes stop_codon:yes gene_type:complete